MERKEFIKNCGLVCVYGLVLPAFLQSCSSTNYFAQSSVENNQIKISKGEFLKTKGNKTTQRKYILVKSDKYPFPIGVYKLSDDEYSALLMQCTHNGCELQPHGDFLICPCHGSEFTNKGVVQNPPAEQNLQTLKTITDNEFIYVQL